jgi:hypothetical protein
MADDVFFTSFTKFHWQFFDKFVTIKIMNNTRHISYIKLDLENG